MWLTLATSASYVLRDDAEWQIAYALLSPINTTTAIVTNHHGDTVYELHTGLLNKAMVYPLKVVLSDPKRANWPSKKCTLEATGLGGSDLSFQDKADITVRTDKHKQNIYGPSMTTVEPVAKCHIFGTTSTMALGISKAAPRVPGITLFLPLIASFTGTCFYMKSCHYYRFQYLQCEGQKLFISCREPILHRHTDECLTTRGKIPFP